MATSTRLVGQLRHHGVDGRRPAVRRSTAGGGATAVRQAELHQGVQAASRIVRAEQWLVVVLRDGEVINARVAPAELAQAYAQVFQGRYPDDQIRARPAAEHEIAYPPHEPYDPRD